MRGARPADELALRHAQTTGKHLVLEPTEALSGRALEIFTEAALDIARLGIAQPSDRVMLASYALAAASAEAALLALAVDDLPPGSAERKRTAVEASGSLTLAIRLGETLALSPVSRTRFGVKHLEGRTLLKALADGGVIGPATSPQ